MIGDVYVVPGDLESTWKKVGNSAGNFLPRADRTVTLSQLSGPVTHTFYGSAIWAIDQQLRQYLNDRKQLLGVYVAPPNDEIDKEFIDQRKGAKRLDLVIYAGIVREVHTVGATGGSAQ